MLGSILFHALKFERFDGFNYNLDRNYTRITKILCYYTSGGGFMQHILIVEDDLDIQDLLRNFFARGRI